MAQPRPDPSPAKTPSAFGPPHRRLTAWAREIHFYCALLLAVVLLFYAATGFLANRAQLFLEETAPGDAPAQSLPPGTGVSARDLAGFLKGVRPGVTVTQEQDGQDEYRAVVETPEGAQRVTVSKEKRTVARATLHPLPPGAGLSGPEVARALAERYSGKLARDVQGHDTVEEDGETMRFDLDSVWGTRSFEVDKQGRRYTVKQHPEGWAEALIALHRSRFTSPTQRALVDATAGLLVLVTITGIFIGLLSPARSRRVWTLALFAASCGILALLIVCR